MGTPRGPLPTPSAVLQMRGSWRGRQRARREPKPKAGTPNKPRWLSESAKLLWPKVVAILEGMPGLLTQADVFVVGRYCEVFVDWLRCVEGVRKHGEGVVVEEKGIKKALHFPHASYRIKYEEILGRLEGKLGLSPADRARISLDMDGAPKAGDDRERFFDAG